MTELEELMKLLKVNNEMYAQDHPMGVEQPYYPTPMPRNNLPAGGGPMVIVSSAGGIRHFEDVTDVSGLGIDRPRRPSSSMQRVGIIANEDSINSASDWNKSLAFNSQNFIIISNKFPTAAADNAQWDYYSLTQFHLLN